MHPQSARARRFIARSAVVVLSAGVILSALMLTTGSLRAEDQEPLRVKLVIDYNDGVEKHFKEIPWKKGMTVLDAMKHARKSPHGITFDYTGSGSTAFLTKIDDLKNQGGGKNSKNWILRVNKKLSTKGFGVYELNAKDVVRWRFEKFKI